MLNIGDMRVLFVEFLIVHCNGSELINSSSAKPMLLSMGEVGVTERLPITTNVMQSWDESSLFLLDIHYFAHPSFLGMGSPEPQAFHAIRRKVFLRH